jgi:homoserine dehydrogenase
MKIQKIPLVCLGAGTVGKELISQILIYGQTITQRTGFSLVPIVIADSTGALVNPKGLALGTLQSVLDEGPKRKELSSLNNFSAHPALDEISQQGLIVIDVTASSDTEPFLRETLENGFGVVLANKIPLTGPWQKARKFFENLNVRYECTAGAGLPLIETLNYLLDTGDQITAIEGCFSGTLGYLCTELEQKVSYSEAVLTACEMGYAEPDPRIDLSGKDVARKALILARTAGWSLTEEDLQTHPLYPEDLANIPLDSFLSEMHSLDDEYRSRFESALASNKTLRYVARINANEGDVGLRSVNRASSLGTLRGPANYISIQTRRYFENPLIISGPGAGPAVTAAGVLGDVIKLAQRNQRG